MITVYFLLKTIDEVNLHKIARSNHSGFLNLIFILTGSWHPIGTKINTTIWHV